MTVGDIVHGFGSEEEKVCARDTVFPRSAIVL